MRLVHCSRYLELRAQDTWRQSEQAIARYQQIRKRSWFGLHRRSASAAYAEAQQRTTDAEAMQRGLAGEQFFLTRLAATLDDRYLLLHSFPSPAGRGDIDGVLVGPHGVTVFEVKAWRGHFQAMDAGWFYLPRSGSPVPARSGNPSAQVLRNVDALRQWLVRNRFTDVPSAPLIAIASPQMVVVPLQGQSVPLLYLPDTRLRADGIVGRMPARLSASRQAELEEALLTCVPVHLRQIQTLSVPSMDGRSPLWIWWVITAAIILILLMLANHH